MDKISTVSDPIRDSVLPILDAIMNRIKKIESDRKLYAEKNMK